MQGDLKEITKYEANVTPLLGRGEVVSQSKFLPSDDAKGVEDDTNSLKERFEKLKADETDRKQRYESQHLLGP